jgi:hypothetical protein
MNLRKVSDGTKKEARLRKENWNKAIAEGRVLRYNDGMSFKEFKTAEEANKAMNDLPGATIVNLHNK